MHTLAISRLHWKELRTQGVIWAALYIMSVIFAIAVIVLVDRNNLALAIDSLIFAAPALFGLACGAFAFASEDETGTISVLRRLPITSRDLLRAKLGFGLTGLALFYVVFAATVWIIAAQITSASLSAPTHLHYAFWGIEALLWSTLFSMRSRSSFAAATWGAVTVALITLVFEFFGAANWYYELGLLLARFVLLGYVAARLVPEAAEWFHDFETPARATRLSWLIQRVHGIPRDVARVLWLSWRENRMLILACAAVVAVTLISAMFFYLNGRIEYAEYLAKRDEYYNNWRQPISHTLPPYFSTLLAATVIGDILFAALGLVVYGTTRQLRSVPLLVNQGISARLIALVRTLLFLGIATIICAVAVGSAVSYSETGNRGRESYDGLLILVFATLLPLWCFVGAYWTSFHTNKKVLAYLVGIILALAAASLQFIFAQARIDLRLFEMSIFLWLSIATIGYTILFAPGWALQRSGRLHRLASWSLLPLALGGIYAGTAIYRVIDTPDSSNFKLSISMPLETANPKVIDLPSRINLRELLGERILDRELLTWFRVQGYQALVFELPQIEHAWFEAWLSTDKTSIRWRAANLDFIDEISKCFLELEPEISFVRDQLLTENCFNVVSGSEMSGRIDRWLLLGAYVKLKQSNPSESLAYIRAMIHQARNERRSHSYLLSPFADQNAGTNQEEVSALTALSIWGKHPSVSKSIDLVEQAIGMLADPSADRSLHNYRIVSRQQWLKSQPWNIDFVGGTFDDRITLLVSQFAPWETTRRQSLIDQAAFFEFQLRNDPSIANKKLIQTELRRYGNQYSRFFKSDFEMVIEKRIATKKYLESVLDELSKGEK